MIVAPKNVSRLRNDTTIRTVSGVSGTIPVDFDNLGGQVIPYDHDADIVGWGTPTNVAAGKWLLYAFKQDVTANRAVVVDSTNWDVINDEPVWQTAADEWNWILLNCVKDGGGVSIQAVFPGNQSDHGALDGLGDDDHTQYLLADGSRNFADGTASNLTSTGGVETVTAVTSGPTMTLDMDAGPRHNMNTQDENTTLALANAATGKSASAALKQGAGGGFTINVPGGWIPVIAPSPTTNASEWNFIEVWQDGADIFYTLKGQV